MLLFLLLDFSSRRGDTPASGAETALVESGMLPPYMLTAKLTSASCAMVEGGIAPFRRGSPLGLYVQEQPRLLESFTRLANIGAHTVRIGKWARETTSGDLSPVVPIRRAMLPAAGHWHNLIALARRRINCVKLGDVVFDSALAVGSWAYGEGEGLAAGCCVQEFLDLECRRAASAGGGGGRDLPGNQSVNSKFPSSDGFEVFATDDY